MSTRVLGFAGIECYDIMIYLAMTLRTLGNSVLLADCSDNRALQGCIPKVEGWGDKFRHWNGIEYAMDLECLPEDYDCVLIDFGKNTQQFNAECQGLFLVTDYQRQNVEWLAGCEFPEELHPNVILRDRLSSKITPNYVSNELSALGVVEGDIIVIEDSVTDLETRLLCQYNARFGFKGVSQSIRDFIVGVAGEGRNRKEVIGAMKRAARGK